MVRSSNAPPWRGEFAWADKIWPCALGRAGISRAKREGDGATPAGRLAIRRVFYRADRIAPPPGFWSALGRATPIIPPMRWRDAPASPQYNRLALAPAGDRTSEPLWRGDHLYDVLAALGHNDDPPAPGMGSAIFLHASRDGLGPTAGCVALPLARLIAFLAACAPGSTIDVRAD